MTITGIIWIILIIVFTVLWGIKISHSQIRKNIYKRIHEKEKTSELLAFYSVPIKYSSKDEGLNHGPHSKIANVWIYENGIVIDWGKTTKFIKHIPVVITSNRNNAQMMFDVTEVNIPIKIEVNAIENTALITYLNTMEPLIEYKIFFPQLPSELTKILSSWDNNKFAF